MFRQCEVTILWFLRVLSRAFSDIRGALLSHWRRRTRDGNAWGTEGTRGTLLIHWRRRTCVEADWGTEVMRGASLIHRRRRTRVGIEWGTEA